MKYLVRKWTAVAVLLGAVALLAWAQIVPSGGGTAQAARPNQPQPGAQVRRESVPPSTGPAPLTGPASPYQPLDLPNWGDNVRANDDTQSPNLAQQEPSIAVNPLNPLNVVAAAKDERAGSNTKQIWIYTSTDGGQTWLNQIFPLLPPTATYSSDPVVNFSDDGICYVTALPYGSGNVGIQVSKSTDGGLTFQTPTIVTTNPNSDKEWTWIDNYPSSPYYHRVYVAWMDFSPGFRVTYSTDRGATWLQSSVGQSANQFPMPVVLPNGDVIVTYRATGGNAAYIRSTNGGQSFGTQQSIAGITTPSRPPGSVFRLSPVPATGVNRNNGALITMWADGQGGTSTIRYSRSTDNGNTWSPSAVLAPSGVAQTYQIEPWVEADEQGTWHSIWYDDRDNPNTPTFHIYYSQSTDDGATWSNAVRISTASSNLNIGIPSSYAQAAGDYINITASHGNVYGVWTDTRSGTGEDVYVVRGTYNQGTPTPTVTGTPPTATMTSTSTATGTGTVSATWTSTATRTPTSVISATVIGGTATSTSTGVVTPPTTTTETGTPTPTHTQGPSPTCSAVPTFTDVQTSDWFYEFVRCIYCSGAISGYNDGTFRPYNNITRGQLTKIVVIAFQMPVNTQGAPHFTDVDSANVFYPFIETAYNRGIISGYADNTFRPNANVTRGQITKIVVLAAGWALHNPLVPSFIDVPRTDPFYQYIETAVCRQVISGYSDRTFRPGNPATRAQIAKIVCLATRNPPDTCPPDPTPTVVINPTATITPIPLQLVSVTDYAFSPATLVFPLGGTVRWTNNSQSQHRIVSNNGAFDSGVLNPGQSYYYFAGIVTYYPYHCSIHPSMTGSFTLEDPSKAQP